MPQHLIALGIGFLLDLVIGDPHWMPHPIRAIGNLISQLERPLRNVFRKTARGEFAAGVFLVVLVAAISTGISYFIIWVCGLVNVWLATAVESVMCYQMLATKALRDESMNVYKALRGSTIEEARKAVSMIVGRDTASLDEKGVTKAAVETVAENASDGVIAPMLFMALGGAPLGVFYKACNTMDSMVGYKNDKYRNFGTAAAKFDDVLNFIPARVAGVLMCFAAWFARFDFANAWKIFLRDRKNHTSPNSAHTEAACAGALDIQLAGSNWYFGKLVEKPTIGDALREVEIEDIPRSNKLMYSTAFLGLLLSLALSFAVFVIGGLL